MFAALTGAGLSAAAGLNAYIPYLVVALLARFTDVITLPSGFSWVESTPSIVIASILLVGEIIVDKIPALDSVNDALGAADRVGADGGERVGDAEDGQRHAAGSSPSSSRAARARARQRSPVMPQPKLS